MSCIIDSVAQDPHFEELSQELFGNRLRAYYLIGYVTAHFTEDEEKRIIEQYKQNPTTALRALDTLITSEEIA